MVINVLGRFFLTISLIAATACGGPISDESETREPAVYGGQVASANQFPAVGKLIYHDRTHCTVTLIRPRVVVTASHCLEGAFSIFAMDPTDFTVYFASLNRTYRVVDIDRPLFRDLTFQGRFADVAVLLLDEKVPVTPMRISRSVQLIGTKTTVVGYGRTSVTSAAGTLRYGYSTISSLPLKAGLTTGLIEAGPGAAGVCFADSGGPWLVGGYVAGITHGSQSRIKCTPNTSVDLVTAMSIWGSWVDRAADRMQGKADAMAKDDSQFMWFNDMNATELFSESPVAVNDLITQVQHVGDYNGDGCDDDLTWRRTALSQPDTVSVVHGCGKGSRTFKVQKGLRMIHTFDADGSAGDDVALQMSNRITVLVPKSGGQYEWTGLPASYDLAFADVDGQSGGEILLVAGSRIDLLSWRTKQHTTSYISIPSAYSGINGTYDVDGKAGQELVLTVVGGLRIVSFPSLRAQARVVAFPGTSWTINGHQDLDGDGDDEIVVAQPGVVRIVDATTVTPFAMPTKHYIIYGVGQTDAVAGDEVILRTGAGIRVLNYKNRKLTAASSIPPWRSCEERESCNGKDDDCDGVIDEGILCGFGAVCSAGECVCPSDTPCLSAPTLWGVANSEHPYFQWGESYGVTRYEKATHYILRVEDPSGTPVYEAKHEAKNVCKPGCKYWLRDRTLAEGAYKWRVRGWREGQWCCKYSPWSAVGDFTVGCATNPIGRLDSVKNGVATGWACDKDDPSASIDVEIYVDSPKVEGQGQWPPVYHPRVTANLRHEPAVTQACGGGTAHRFRVRIHDEVLKNGVPIYAYGINLPGVGCGKDTQLSGSPKKMQCADARPIGWLDSVSGGVARGWACDPDDPMASILVSLFAGGPNKPRGDTTVQMITVRADRPSEPAVAARCGGGTAHRFERLIPGLRPGVPVYAKGHNILCGGGDSDLSGSPKSL